MAILSFRFVLVAFLARFLKTEAKQALLSLFLEVLDSGGKEVDGEEVDGKVVYSKNVGSRRAGSGKVSRFLMDFALFLLFLSTKSCKERSGIYFLKLY